jgi:hypothetical protein
VKDPADVYVAPEIRRHLDRFYVTHGKDKAYADLLGAKHKDLMPHANAVADALRLPDAGDLAYEIGPVFVTRRPVPAGFAGGPFPFTTIRELPQTLSAAERHALAVERRSADADAAFRDCPCLQARRPRARPEACQPCRCHLSSARASRKGSWQSSPMPARCG